MLQDVVSVSLPVNERMMIKKNHFEPYNLTGNEKRICIVTGIHGDELEGQYVCYELIRKLSENRHLLSGIVDIYPSMNPLGMDSIKREMPIFDLDMNMIFPGSETGAVAEHIAAAIMNDIKGADICIDIHASNIFLREIPQVRISEETAPKLLPYAKMLNVDFIWVHSSVTVMEATLSHSLNKEGTPTLVAEMGVGMRITKSYGDQLLDGIIRLLAPHRLNHLYETIQLCHTFTDTRNRPCYAQCIVKAHILCVRVLLHPIDRRCSDATLWHVNDSPYRQVILAILNRL